MTSILIEEIDVGNGRRLSIEVDGGLIEHRPDPSVGIAGLWYEIEDWQIEMAILYGEDGEELPCTFNNKAVFANSDCMTDLITNAIADRIEEKLIEAAHDQ